MNSRARVHNPTDPIQMLRQEFRTHLEHFYAHLKLAPPYHSIEKAVQLLANHLKTQSKEMQRNLLQDSTKKWTLFQDIFSASGLPQKHRGIITQLANSTSYSETSSDSLRFISKFMDSPPKKYS